MGKMHTSAIRDRWQPRVVVDVLKDASGPLTMQEVYDEIRSRGYNKFSPSMVGACFAEIRDDKGCEGYGMSPAVRFPDGYHRYWLTAAPKWTRRWIVTRDFRVVPIGSGAQELSLDASSQSQQPQAEPSRPVQATAEDPVRICAYEHCGQPVPVDRLRLMCVTCCDEHSRLWRESMRPKVAQGMLL